MIPFESIDNPFGKFGDVEKLEMAPPPKIGKIDEIAISRVNVNVLGLNEIIANGSLMMMAIEVELEPPLLLAQIVYVVRVRLEIGVPEMVPELLLNIRPDGKFGLIHQVSMIPPKFENVIEVIRTSFVNSGLLVEGIMLPCGSLTVIVKVV